MVAVPKKGRKNEKQLAMEYLLYKTIMAKVAKVLSVINLGVKYSQAISNTDINIARDLRLTCIKKYW